MTNQPPHHSKLDHFIRVHHLKRNHLAEAANLSRQHLYRLRLGTASATIDTARRLATGCSNLLGRAVGIGELFDIGEVD
jgi:transcriptional regulator with XRE-family HTH domain